MNVISRTKGVDTAHSDEEIEDQGTEGWDSFRAGAIDMEEEIREAGLWAVGRGLWERWQTMSRAGLRNMKQRNRQRPREDNRSTR